MASHDSVQDESFLPPRYHPRSIAMCTQCRSDKQACKPSNRSWHDLKQRCDRCVRLQLPCSESQKLPAKSRRASKLAGMGPEVAHDIQSAVSGPPSNLNTFSQGDAHGEPSSLDTSLTDDSNMHVENPQKCSGVVLIEKPCRKQIKRTAQLLLKELGDIEAAQTHWKHDLRKVLQYELRLGRTNRTNQISELLKQKIMSITSHASGLLKNGMDLLSQGTGDYKTFFRHRLRDTMNRIYNHSLNSFDAMNFSLSTTDEHSEWQLQFQRDFYESIEAAPHSIAGFVSASLSETMTMSTPSMIFPTEEAISKYRQAAADLRSLLLRQRAYTEDQQDINYTDSSLSQPVKSYTALHLAYRTGNRLVTHRLCEDSEAHNAADPLGQTVLHYAVESNDIQTVQVLMTANKNILKTTGPDVFDLTPVGLAAMHGHAEVLKELVSLEIRNTGPSTPLLISGGRSVLGIAAQFGREKVVKLMLEQNMIHPLCPIVSDLTHAIEGHQEATAQLLFSVMIQKPWLPEALRRAAAAAEYEHLHNLVRDIYQELREPKHITASIACSAMDAQEYGNFLHSMNHLSSNNHGLGSFASNPLYSMDQTGIDVLGSKAQQQQIVYADNTVGFRPSIATSDNRAFRSRDLPGNNHAYTQVFAVSESDLYPQSAPTTSSLAQSPHLWSPTNQQRTIDAVTGRHQRNFPEAHQRPSHLQMNLSNRAAQAHPENAMPDSMPSEWATWDDNQEADASPLFDLTSREF